MSRPVSEMVIGSPLTQAPDPAATPQLPPARGARSARLARTLRGQGLLLMLVVLIVIFSVQTSHFFTISNMWVVLGSSAVLGLMALPQTFLVISGGLDLSVGSVVALSSILIGSVTTAGMSPWLGSGLALLAALVVGAINAFIVIALGVNPLITTLGTLSIVQGIAYLIANAQTFLINDESFYFLGIGRFGEVPFVFVLFAIALVAFLFIERLTVFGRSVFAIGSNIEAARLSGIRVRAIPVVLYLASAFAGGIGGVILSAQLGAASADVGTSYQLSVVTAVILGGASLAGGRGTVIGTTIAVLILGVLQNGFALLGLSAYVQTISLGSALILAVLLDQTTRRVERGRS